ncbi:hypothetical protein Cyrtocomes_01017 [Candidatus Cyrtobacter comes]|uniref:Uncharacterized protein n=1 Tax=Candidatus Cyrtobacter comes TaxID=675776 RepID=A0ABU5L927_9RICK|nr:hypothetical protein [Candidatus Cyrtobacter comes]MDZ5762626.1 hypothetical protein [Candidatus Cyrtobacter comes]
MTKDFYDKKNSIDHVDQLAEFLKPEPTSTVYQLSENFTQEEREKFDKLIDNQQDIDISDRQLVISELNEFLTNANFLNLDSAQRNDIIEEFITELTNSKRELKESFTRSPRKTSVSTPGFGVQSVEVRMKDFRDELNEKLTLLLIESTILQTYSSMKQNLFEFALKVNKLKLKTFIDFIENNTNLNDVIIEKMIDNVQGLRLSKYAEDAQENVINDVLSQILSTYSVERGNSLRRSFRKYSAIDKGSTVTDNKDTQQIRHRRKGIIGARPIITEEPSEEDKIVANMQAHAVLAGISSNQRDAEAMNLNELKIFRHAQIFHKTLGTVNKGFAK